MKKKVLIVYSKGTGELLNRQSALGSYIFCLAQLLHEQGFEIFINGTNSNKLEQGSGTNPVIASRMAWFKKAIPFFVKEVKRKRHLSLLHKSVLNQSRKVSKVDAVLEFYTFGSRLGIQLSAENNCPLVTVFDSPVLEEYRFFNGNYLFGKRKIETAQNDTLKLSSKVVVYSNPVLYYVAAITGKRDRIRIHQNVDFTRFDFIDPRPVLNEIHIGFIGSFLKWHRVDLLIEIFERIKRNGLPVRLWLVGNGMEYAFIKDRLNKSAFKEYIELTGFLDGAQLLEVKKKLHIGVMPGSNWYGAPNKIFEYGAAGMAVMAPLTPTISDLFTANEVLMFEQDNVDSAYAVLNKIVTDEKLLTCYQQTLQSKIKQKYGKENTHQFYTTLINEAMQF